MKIPKPNKYARFCLSAVGLIILLELLEFAFDYFVGDGDGVIQNPFLRFPLLALQIIAILLAIVAGAKALKIGEKKEKPGTAKTIAFNLLLVFLLFGVVELGFRLSGNHYGCEAILQSSLFSTRYPAKFDSLLGYVPKPEYSSDSVNIDERGIRKNGNAPPQNSELTILTAGDSYTYGAEVKDDQSWPAILERISGHRVINCGVFGYGLDQAVLRAEKLLEQVQPDIVILSFINDDIVRCRMNKRTNAGKPYFVITDGKLELETKHIEFIKPEENNNAFKLFLSRSRAIHYFMSTIFPEYWYNNTSRGESDTGQDVNKIANLLIDRFLELGRQKDIEIVILVQYTKYLMTEFTGPLVQHIKTRQVKLVDLYADLSEIKTQKADEFASLYIDHMTEKGNTLVARRICKDMNWNCK